MLLKAKYIGGIKLIWPLLADVIAFLMRSFYASAFLWRIRFGVVGTAIISFQLIQFIFVDRKGHKKGFRTALGTARVMLSSGLYRSCNDPAFEHLYLTWILGSNYWSPHQICKEPRTNRRFRGPNHSLSLFNLRSHFIGHRLCCRNFQFSLS